MYGLWTGPTRQLVYDVLKFVFLKDVIEEIEGEN